MKCIFLACLITIECPADSQVDILNHMRHPKGYYISYTVKMEGPIKVLKSPDLNPNKTYTYYIYCIKPNPKNIGKVIPDFKMAYKELEVRAGGCYHIKFTEKDFK